MYLCASRQRSGRGAEQQAESGRRQRMLHPGWPCSQPRACSRPAKRGESRARASLAPPSRMISCCTTSLVIIIPPLFMSSPRALEALVCFRSQELLWSRQSMCAKPKYTAVSLPLARARARACTPLHDTNLSLCALRALLRPLKHPSKAAPCPRPLAAHRAAGSRGHRVRREEHAEQRELLAAHAHVARAPDHLLPIEALLEHEGLALRKRHACARAHTHTTKARGRQADGWIDACFRSGGCA